MPQGRRYLGTSLCCILGNALTCIAQSAPPFVFTAIGGEADNVTPSGGQLFSSTGCSGSLSFSNAVMTASVSSNASSVSASYRVFLNDSDTSGTARNAGGQYNYVFVYVLGPPGTVVRVTQTASATLTTSVPPGGTYNSAYASSNIGPVFAGVGPYFPGLASTQSATSSQTQDFTAGSGSITCGHYVYTYVMGFRTDLEVQGVFGPAMAEADATQNISAMILKPGQQPPTAVIDPVGSAIISTPTTLSGIHSFDTDGDSIIQYQWTIKDAGGNVIATPSGATTSFSFPAAGMYTVGLTVTDSDGQTGSTGIGVSVSNAATGTINVSTNLSAATFTITGPGTYIGSGTTFAQTNAPTGTYTAAFGPVEGFTTPPSQTVTLAPGGSITFTGSYQPVTGTISVTTNQPAATFTISGPASFSGGGTSFSASSAPAGKYTATFGPIAGYETPPSQTQTLIAAGSISFVGAYQKIVLELTLDKPAIAPSREARTVCVQTGAIYTQACPSQQWYTVPAITNTVLVSGLVTDVGGNPVLGQKIEFSAKASDLATNGGHRNHSFAPDNGDFEQIACSTDSAGLCSVTYDANDAAGLYELIGTLSSGQSDSKALAVKLDLGALPPASPGGSYVIVRGGTSLHPNGTNGTAALVLAVQALANAYSSRSGNALSINDMSLAWGGIFDLAGDWGPPHVLHQTGQSVDINGVSMTDPNKALLYTLATALGFVEVAEGVIHYELQ